MPQEQNKHVKPANRLQRLVRRFTLLRMMFYRNFKPGQRYILVNYATNRFGEKNIVEIKQVKGRWINYRFVGSVVFVDEIMKRSTFNYYYMRYDA